MSKQENAMVGLDRMCETGMKNMGESERLMSKLIYSEHLIHYCIAYM
jgi:hypothetical protein